MILLEGMITKSWQLNMQRMHTIKVGMTSDFFKLLTLLFFQVQCEELKETIQENFTWIKSVQ